MSEARVVRLEVMASSVVLLAACGRGATTAPRPEPAEAPVFVEQAPVAPPQPEEAWFLIEDTVVRLDVEGFTTISGSSGLYVSDLFLADDGRGYLLTGRGIRTIVGDDVEMVVEFNGDNEGSDRGAVGHDAYLALWSAGEKLSLGRGGSWTIEIWDEWVPEEVGFDPTGTAWVKGFDRNGQGRLWHRGPSGWIAAELGEPPREYSAWRFYSLHASAQALYAAGDGYLMRILGPNRVDRIDLALPAFPELEGETTRWFGYISVNADGDVALASTNDFVRFEGDAKLAKIVTLEGYEHLTAFGFDASDRIWVASGATIRVVPPAGEVIEIPSGSVPELLAGVRDLVVLGKGPELPDPAPIRRNSVTGSVNLDSVPVPNRKLLACQEPANYSDPCQRARNWASTTDAEGRFSLADLPLGNYVLAVELHDDEIGEHWVNAGPFEVREGKNPRPEWFDIVP